MTKAVGILVGLAVFCESRLSRFAGGDTSTDGTRRHGCPGIDAATAARRGFLKSSL